MDKPILNPALFWDTKESEIDYDAHARYVIARVMMRGDMPDFREIISYYIWTKKLLISAIPFSKYHWRISDATIQNHR